MHAKDLQAFGLIHIASGAFSGLGEAMVRNRNRLISFILCAAAIVRSDPNLEVTARRLRGSPIAYFDAGKKTTTEHCGTLQFSKSRT